MTTTTALRRTVYDTAIRASRTAAFDVLAAALDRLGSWPRGTLAVLTYHRIDEPGRRPDLAPSLLSATPRMLDDQMAYLAGVARPIGADELLRALDDPGRLGDRSVLVTVDDAYADFDEHGWPIFRRHGVPVVLFVPTAFPADPATAFWWDRLHAALRAAGRAGVDRISTPMLGPIELGTRSAAASERLRAHFKAMPHDAMTVALDELIAAIGRRTSGSPLTREVGRAILDWDALRRLAREGVALAPHGRSHAFLDRVDPTALAAEVAGSRRDLERETGSALPLFAYPSGQYDETAVAAVAAAGFAAAFTTRRGTNDLRSTDPLLLRRINVGGRSTVGLLRAQLAPTTVRLGTAVRRWQTPASEHSASRT